MISIDRIFRAFALTLAAGLCTGAGGGIAFLSGRNSRRFLSVSLSFSAGVMIYVSMIEIFFQAQEALCAAYGGHAGALFTVLAFFGGMGLIAALDRLIPEGLPAGPEYGEETASPASAGLIRTGIYSAAAIAVHNFPEGIATFLAALQRTDVAIPVVAAIAIHNIPEGISVSVPLYQATGSRKKALGYSFLSGLAEPAGALMGWLLLGPFLSGPALGLLFAGVAGVMVYLSVDELLPAAQRYGEQDEVTGGLIAGMAVMAGSLLLLSAV